MIVNFTVSNFRSIKDEQSISFLSTPDRHNRDLISVEVDKGVHVNKLAIFFGANASGKSNMLHAMTVVFQILGIANNDKATPIKNYCPFKLENTRPTQIKIEFYAEGKHYWYDVTYDKDNILEECLYYTPLKKKSLFYTRIYTGADSQPKIEFGNTLHLNLKTKESIRESTFNNHSVLSSISKLSLKEEDARELKQLHNWVMNHVHSLSGDPKYNRYIKELGKINSDQRKKEFYIKLLAKADFNITGFRLVDNKAKLPKEFVDEILNKNMSEEDKTLLLNKVMFTNKSENGDFDIPLELQSEGTLRFIELLEVLYDLVSGSHIYLLDELGNRMHYDLMVYYLTLFLFNSEESQVFFTSQSILLLDEDFIRRDIVYLSEKGPDTASTTYTRVSDLELHKNLSLYNAYRIGRLGSKPELGSPYLNLKKD